MPFTYIFAVGGTPLEILAGVVDENDLKEKIKKAVQVSSFLVVQLVLSDVVCAVFFFYLKIVKEYFFNYCKQYF